MKQKSAMAIQGLVSVAIAFLSDKLGILFPVLCMLMLMMILDYVTGMLASKAEAIEHPDDPNYGWSSKKGAKGIIKKVGYMCVVMVAMVLDYMIASVSGTLSIEMPSSVFFGLTVSVWYILNELLSVIENAGRMGVPVPKQLAKYIATLKHQIDKTEDEKAGEG